MQPGSGYRPRGLPAIASSHTPHPPGPGNCQRLAADYSPWPSGGGACGRTSAREREEGEGSWKE